MSYIFYMLHFIYSYHFYNYVIQYKYDIPVLHINDKYWIKHRLSKDEAIQGLESIMDGTFVESKGDPDATAMERQRLQI